MRKLTKEKLTQKHCRSTKSKTVKFVLFICPIPAKAVHQISLSPLIVKFMIFESLAMKICQIVVFESDLLFPNCSLALLTGARIKYEMVVTNCKKKNGMAICEYMSNMSVVGLNCLKFAIISPNKSVTRHV